MIDHIGLSQVTRDLGRGGMGAANLARDARLDRDVAIKALPEHLAIDPDRPDELARHFGEVEFLVGEAASE